MRWLLLLLPGLCAAATIEPEGAARRLARGEAACVRCHPTVVAQWAQSAHRHSSLDNPWYTGALRAFVAHRPNEGAFCGGCHDPALIAAGTMSPEATGPAAHAGIGCLTCHSITRHAIEGNGGYHAQVDPVPLKAGHAERVAIKAPLKLCASCHKVSLPEAASGAHWQRGQNQYDAWYDSAWAGRGLGVILRPKSRATCLDCHMPRVNAGPDDEGVRDGLVRDHRFVGGHAALPALFNQPTQVAAVTARLSSAISMDLRSARAGYVDVVLRNIGVGHPFPGGTQDAKQAWLEVTVFGADDGVLARHGHLERNRLPADAWLLRTHPVDGEGHPIVGRAAWHQRGVIADTRLPPGAPRVARFALPEGAARVAVRLRFRRFGLDDLDVLCATAPDPQRCKTVPIIEIAQAQAPITDGHLPPSDDWRRLVAHGLGLTTGLTHHVADAEAVLRRAATLAPQRPETTLALAKLAAAQGRTDDVVAHIQSLTAPPPTAWWILAKALTRAFRHAPALAAAERLLAAVPDDRHALALTARLRSLNTQPRGARAAAQALLTLDPESAEGWFQAMMAQRELGEPSDEARAAWLRYRTRDELDRRLRHSFQALYPERAALTHGVGPR